MNSKVTSRTFATEQVKKQVLQEIGMFVSTQVTNINSETNGVLREKTILEAAYSETGNADQALTYLARAQQPDPGNKYIINGLGWTNFQKADYPLAIVWLNKAIETDATFSEPYYNLGLGYEKQGNKKLSNQNLKKAAQLSHEKARQKLGVK